MLNFLFAVFFTALGVGLIWWFATWRRWLDVPNERSSHEQPTPTGGGIAIVLVLLFLILKIGGSPAMIFFAGGLLFLAAVSLLDDWRELAISRRFVVHLLAAALVSIGGLFFTGGSVLFYLFSFALIVSMINLYNFMDGIDGLAGLEGLAGGIFLAWVLAGEQARFFYVPAGCCLGFLLWNFPWRGRAKIFMGDVGSTALGFSFPALVALMPGGDWSMWVAFLLIFANFIVDGAMTLAIRIWRGEQWYRPHRRHLYQLLVAAGFSHRQVSLGEGGVMLSGFLTALLYRHLPLALGGLAVMLYAVLLLFTWVRVRRWALTKLTVSTPA
ncbi:MAG: glycosyltransferase family 4 protein [Pseudomonadota bacterium]|nr:glycosyltransferase family 4 protein [Pseudomonadota bacterium]